MKSLDQESARATVYYDGQCPLCSREISALQSKCEVNTRLGVAITFNDVHDHLELPQNKEVLLKDLHLYFNDGRKLVGIDANIFMWRQAGLSFLPHFMSLPIVYHCARWCYRKWADRRFNKLYVQRSNNDV